MRALRTSVPLRTLQQPNSTLPCRAPVLFKPQLYTPYTRTSIHNHGSYLRTFYTTSPTLQSLSPQPTSPPSAQVEITTGKLAAPNTTLPGDLETPERLKDDSAIGYYFKVGKGYLSFYKTGLKNVYRNFVASRDLQKRIDTEGKGSITELVDQGKITRGEFQFVMRTRHDSRRIPLFALMFLICGEFTPLVVITFSSVVPFPCRIPKQMNSDKAKLHQRRTASFSALPPPPITNPSQQPATTAHTSTPALTKALTTIPPVLDLTHLTHQQLMHVAITLNLAPSISSYVAFPYLLQRRVSRKLEYLELDDTLIERFGGMDALVKEGGRKELEWAAMERGIDTLNRKDWELQVALRGWFKARKEKGRVLPEMFFERR
ncbi:hypothetical protein L211DRAFT_822254 [Terfezia boudieri ATCC MYA-4762]|uniref:Letm1 RBD domain-containing protein n=1 Tax=Terfezia boudieri ATCC MYA-4762 TaxID=1051890 RepID=A0A3N4LRS7_9PEZI|nr:hypothetical protein L211DRAFT_822254 [Terfezia boudieri ATCC MYA-4762]